MIIGRLKSIVTNLYILIDPDFTLTIFISHYSLDISTTHLFGYLFLNSLDPSFMLDFFDIPTHSLDVLSLIQDSLFPFVPVTSTCCSF